MIIIIIDSKVPAGRGYELVSHDGSVGRTGTIYLLIYHTKSIIHVGKYSSPVDPMGVQI